MEIDKRNKVLDGLTKAYLEAPDGATATQDVDVILCSSDFDLLTINHRAHVLAWVRGFEIALWSARGWTHTEPKRKLT